MLEVKCARENEITCQSVARCCLLCTISSNSFVAYQSLATQFPWKAQQHEIFVGRSYSHRHDSERKWQVTKILLVTERVTLLPTQSQDAPISNSHVLNSNKIGVFNFREVLPCGISQWFILWDDLLPDHKVHCTILLESELF